MRTYYVIYQYKSIAWAIYCVLFILFIAVIAIDIYVCYKHNRVVQPPLICQKITDHQRYHAYKEIPITLKQYSTGMICAFKQMDITHEDTHYQVDVT